MTKWERAFRWALGMCFVQDLGLKVGIELRRIDHALGLGLVLACLRLEKLHTALAQGQRDLHAFFLESQLDLTVRQVFSDHEVQIGKCRFGSW